MADVSLADPYIAIGDDKFHLQTHHKVGGLARRLYAEDVGDFAGGEAFADADGGKKGFLVFGHGFGPFPSSARPSNREPTTLTLAAMTARGST